MFLEHNHKERETFVFYLQYTNNEASLKKLEEFIKSSDHSYMDGDYSNFEIDLTVKFSEEMVDQHCKLPFGSYSHMFQKICGTFKYPFDDDYYDEETAPRKMNEFDKAKILDEYFFGCNIGGCFR